MDKAIDFIETMISEALGDDSAFEGVAQETGGGVSLTLAGRDFLITVKEEG
ncbi:hypothetical protein ACIG0A_33295 [Streptomyces californicus]|uniref:hypothetical protein n=1 Tax=Streptomyces californicus TaxID=67351 RepID=UPI0037D549B4